MSPISPRATSFFPYALNPRSYHLNKWLPTNLSRFFCALPLFLVRLCYFLSLLFCFCIAIIIKLSSAQILHPALPPSNRNGGRVVTRMAFIQYSLWFFFCVLWAAPPASTEESSVALVALSLAPSREAVRPSCPPSPCPSGVWRRLGAGRGRRAAISGFPTQCARSCWLAAPPCFDLWRMLRALRSRRLESTCFSWEAGCRMGHSNVTGARRGIAMLRHSVAGDLSPRASADDFRGWTVDGRA